MSRLRRTQPWVAVAGRVVHRVEGNCRNLAAEGVQIYLAERGDGQFRSVQRLDHAKVFRFRLRYEILERNADVASAVSTFVGTNSMHHEFIEITNHQMNNFGRLVVVFIGTMFSEKISYFSVSLDDLEKCIEMSRFLQITDLRSKDLLHFVLGFYAVD